MGAEEALAIGGLGEAGTWQSALELGLPSLTGRIAKKHTPFSLQMTLQNPPQDGITFPDLLYSQPFLLCEGLGNLVGGTSHPS